MRIKIKYTVHKAQEVLKCVTNPLQRWQNLKEKKEKKERLSYWREPYTQQGCASGI